MHEMRECLRAYADKFPSEFADTGPDWEAYMLEVERFFIMKAKTFDLEALFLSPSPLIDRAWHALLLFPIKYSQFCYRLIRSVHGHTLLDGLLDHRPVEDSESTIAIKYRNTLKHYEQIFEEAPPPFFWPVLDEPKDDLEPILEIELPGGLPPYKSRPCNIWIQYNNNPLRLKEINPTKTTLGQIKRDFESGGFGLAHEARISFKGRDLTFAGDFALLKDLGVSRGDHLKIYNQPALSLESGFLC